MLYAARNDDALAGTKSDSATSNRSFAGWLEVNEQLAFDDVEELVLVRMMMPMELTFDDRKPEQAVVDSDQAAVVPRLDGACESRDVEPLKRLVGKFRFEGVVRIHFCHGTVMP